MKIILVGTGNVLSPHKYFQFDQTLKNVVVNSESAFWDILGKSPFGYFPKRLLEGMDGWGPPWGGPTRVVAGQEGGSTLEPDLPTCFPLLPLESVSFMGIFGILNTHPTPWFSYIRRRGGCPILDPCSHTHAIDLSGFCLPPHEIVS